MSSLINSNRKDDVKPQRKASLSDLENNKKKENDKIETENIKQPNTTMTIGVHDRNMMQAFVVLGESKNLKDAFSTVIKNYYDNLPSEKRSMIDMLVKSLNNQK